MNGIKYKNNDTDHLVILFGAFHILDKSICNNLYENYKSTCDDIFDEIFLIGQLDDYYEDILSKLSLCMVSRLDYVYKAFHFRGIMTLNKKIKTIQEIYIKNKILPIFSIDDINNKMEIKLNEYRLIDKYMVDFIFKIPREVLLEYLGDLRNCASYWWD